MSKLQERDVLLEPWFSINIGGKELTEDMLKYVVSVEVVDEENKLSEATIEVADYESKWLTGAGIGKKSSLIIRMGHKKNNNTAFRGKITLIDVDYPEEGYPFLVVKAIDNGVKMMEVKHSKIYKNMKISDVVKAMHKTAGLEIEVEDSKTIIEHIQQSKETYLDFVKRWRKKLGWKYYQKPSGGYYFGTKDITEFPLETLSYREGGLEIISFQPTFAEIEVENKEKEKQINNKDGKEKTSDYKPPAKPKAISSGGDKVVAKAEKSVGNSGATKESFW